MTMREELELGKSFIVAYEADKRHSPWILATASFIMQRRLKVKKIAVSMKELAGLPALQIGEPGQVRKEAATVNYCKCRG